MRRLLSLFFTDEELSFSLLFRVGYAVCLLLVLSWRHWPWHPANASAPNTAKTNGRIYGEVDRGERRNAAAATYNPLAASNITQGSGVCTPGLHQDLLELRFLLQFLLYCVLYYGSIKKLPYRLLLKRKYVRVTQHAANCYNDAFEGLYRMHLRCLRRHRRRPPN